MKWFRKSKRPSLDFEQAARFNRVLDTDHRLRDGIARLAEQYPRITQEEHTRQMLALFSEAGLQLSEKELQTLLALRLKTDQMLLCEQDKACK